MHQSAQRLFGTVGILLIAGCRTATRVQDVPRVDLQLEGGNRGYLVGRPPEASQLKTTRQIVETDIELPSFYKPRQIGSRASLENITTPETEPDEPLQIVSVGPEPIAAQLHDIYLVQKGDSLWSIAAKPEVYGKASRWRQIFDANRDLLKSPDHLKTGMTLKIPRAEDDSDSTTYDDEGIAYKK
jgi:hypothetical protein